MIRDLQRRLSMVGDIKQKLGSITQWIEDHRVAEAENYCNFYIGYLR